MADVFSSPGKQRSMMVWRHNGLVGGCRLFEVVLRQILEVESTTRESREWAWQLLPLVAKLADTLKVRSDHGPTAA